MRWQRLQRRNRRLGRHWGLLLFPHPSPCKDDGGATPHDRSGSHPHALAPAPRDGAGRGDPILCPSAPGPAAGASPPRAAGSPLWPVARRLRQGCCPCGRA